VARYSGLIALVRKNERDSAECTAATTPLRCSMFCRGAGRRTPVRGGEQATSKLARWRVAKHGREAARPGITQPRMAAKRPSTVGGRGMLSHGEPVTGSMVGGAAPNGRSSERHAEPAERPSPDARRYEPPLACRSQAASAEAASIRPSPLQPSRLSSFRSAAAISAWASSLSSWS